MRRYGWRASPSACAAITPAPTASSPPPPAWPVKLRSPRPRYKSFAARSPIFRLPGSRTKYRSSRTRTGSTTWKASVAPAWVSVGLGSRSGSMSVLGLGCVKTPTFNLRVEIPSRFRKFENQKCLRPLLREDDRENNSAHSWLVHVFTARVKTGKALGEHMFSALPQVPRRPVVAGDHDLAVDPERRCLDAMHGMNDGREGDVHVV